MSQPINTLSSISWVVPLHIRLPICLTRRKQSVKAPFLLPGLLAWPHLPLFTKLIKDTKYDIFSKSEVIKAAIWHIPMSSYQLLPLLNCSIATIVINCYHCSQQHQLKLRQEEEREQLLVLQEDDQS